LKNRRPSWALPLDIWKITLIALLVRALTATWTGLTTDEAFAVALASVRPWTAFFELLKHDPNAPLFYGFLCVFAHSFGGRDLAFKILMVVLSTAVVPLIYLICRRFLNREQSSQIALLVALCPPIVRFGTLIRSYALMPMLSVLSTWAFMRVTSARASRVWPVLYGFFTALLVYCHYWGAFVAIGQACLAVIGFARGWYDRAGVFRWLVGVGIALLLFLPWLPTLYFQMTHDLSPWAMPPYVVQVIMLTFPYILTGDVTVTSALGQMILLLCNLFVWLVIICPQAQVTGGKDFAESAPRFSPAAAVGTDSRPIFDGRQWKLVAIFSTLSALVVTFIRPIMRDRYFTPFTPLFLITFVTTFHQLFPRLPAALRYFLPVAVWLPLWLPQLYYFHSHPETNTPAIIRLLKDRADRKKDLVVITWQAIAPAIVFYLPSDLRAISFPGLERTCFTRWDGMAARMRSQENLNKLFATLTDTLSAGGCIWLIDSAREIEEEDFTSSKRVEGESYTVADFRRQDQIRTWLSRHSQQEGDNIMAPGRDFNIFLSIYCPRSEEPAASAPSPRQTNEGLPAAGPEALPQPSSTASDSR